MWELSLVVSTGTDKKANEQAPVRGPGGLLERLQRGVALEALHESGSSFRTELVALETASTEAEAGVNGRWHESKHFGAAAHSSEVTALPLSASHSLVMPSAV